MSKPPMPKAHALSRRATRATAWLVLLLPAPAAAAMPTVEVTTDRGRTHAGVVDARTNEGSLWLRRDEANAAVAVEIAWSSIASLRVDGQDVESDQWKALATGLASDRPALPLLLGPLPDPMTPPPLRRRMRANDEANRVASIHVEACVYNGDRDALSDGVELLLAAHDSAGQAVAVRGDLTVRLLGERAVSRHRTQYGEIARWTKPIRTAHFGGTPFARRRLPYRRPEPDADTGLGPRAVVHVSLGVAGQGRFEASAPVRLRSWDYFRDRLELQTGRRHFPVEPSRFHAGERRDYGASPVLWP